VAIVDTIEEERKRKVAEVVELEENKKIKEDEDEKWK